MVTARLLTIFNVTVASFLCNGTSKPSPRASGKTLEFNTKLQNFIYNGPKDWLNSLAPGKFEWNFRHVILKQISVIDAWGISCESALIWMSLDFTDDQSTLVQVMAWCRQAASHYLSQCWPRSMAPLGLNELNECMHYSSNSKSIRLRENGHGTYWRKKCWTEPHAKSRPTNYVDHGKDIGQYVITTTTPMFTFE